MKGILALATFALLWSCVANATDTYIHVSGVSIHQKSGFNSFNSGIGIEKEIYSDWSISLGTYNNSVNNQSVYVLGKYKVATLSSISFNIVAGGVTGYQNNRISPVIAPEVCLQYVCGLLIPPINDVVVGTIGLYLKLPVN